MGSGCHFRGRESHVRISAKGVMARAWVIFRATYSYPRIPLRSIGRGCFRWALASAWAEVRTAAALNNTSTDVLQERANTIRSELEGLQYATFRRDIGKEQLRLNLALSILVGELDGRPAPLRLAA